ncbi:MAG: ABC transporter substrate-binding protein [Actinomycetota bacterium]|nr:ABC transporter substrate-binding protein [Actinomycetota bacterium]
MPPLLRRARALVLAVLVLSLVAAACGGDGDDDTATASDETTAASEDTSTSDTGADGDTGDGDAGGEGTVGSAADEITEPVTIRFESYNLASAGVNFDATMEMLEDFQEENPLITVETVGTGSEEMFPSLQAQVVAGDPPDVAQVLLREWDQNIENLPLVELEEAFGDEVDEQLESGHPFHPRARMLTERDGQIHGLPYVFSTPTLFYNADLFVEAGLDPEDPPATWDEVAEAAQAVADGTDADGGLYIACIELDWCTQGILLSNGARVMSPDRTEITWASPEAIEVYEFWQDMVESGAHVDMTGADALDAFSAGRLGLYLQTSAVQGRILESSAGSWELRTTGMPAFGDKDPVPVNSGSGLGILATDPVQQRAAWELVKYLTSEDSMQIITTQMGYLPLRPDMIDDPEYLGDWEHRELILPNLDQLDTLEPSLSFPGQNALQIRDEFLESLELVLFNGADATETFTASEADANELAG